MSAKGFAIDWIVRWSALRLWSMLCGGLWSGGFRPAILRLDLCRRRR
ncbi:hypothetical protein LINPERHAP1_LOCUS4457, partial [Linum perenne]